jgi:hypothetical protein
MVKRGPVFGAPPAEPKPRNWTGWIIFLLIVLLLGGGFWYYFFGQKPRMVLSVPLAKQEGEERNGLWPVGNGELLLLGNGEVKLVNVADRAVKWTAKLPPAPAVDRAWRAAVNARFVRLQQWADELTTKRANLKTPKDTKAFNDEAAKYQAELTAVRTELGRRPSPSAAPAAPPKPAAPVVAAKKEPEPEPAEKLKPIASPEVQLLEQRIQRRTVKLAEMERNIAIKKAAAKTEIQMSVVHDEEARFTALTAEQKAEQEALAKLQGTFKPPVAADDEGEDEEDVDSFFVDSCAPYGGTVGGAVWIVDGEHMVSFDRATGAVKSDVALAGPALRAWTHGGELCVVASAGDEARQITRITATAGPVSLYAPAGKVESAFGAMEDSGIKPNVQSLRTEFGGPLFRADIRLVEKKLIFRDAIKPGSEQALTDTISGSAAHSLDELQAVAKLMSNDAKVLTGETKEWIDDSTYELTLRRPFDPSAPEWKGAVKGRVDFFATPSYDLVAAGTKLLAFDHVNKKLWEATLGAPVAPRADDDEKPTETCLESEGRLYFADGAFLTAFEAATGRVLWRVPSIGIQKVQVDGDGNVYVQTLNLATESLTYVLDESFQAIDPLTLKINPDDGKIVWKAEKYQDLWVSGSDVYVLRESRNPTDIENQVFDPSKVPEARVKIYKLSRRNGESIWEWFQARRPRAVHADRKNVGILFGDELQFIHSIAL